MALLWPEKRVKVTKMAWTGRAQVAALSSKVWHLLHQYYSVRKNRTVKVFHKPNRQLTRLEVIIQQSLFMWFEISLENGFRMWGILPCYTGAKSNSDSSFLSCLFHYRMHRILGWGQTMWLRMPQTGGRYRKHGREKMWWEQYAETPRSLENWIHP